MSSTYDKLTYLNETKNEIKNALIEKGQQVTELDTFRSYANKILEIPPPAEIKEMFIGYVYIQGFQSDRRYETIEPGYIPIGTRCTGGFNAILESYNYGTRQIQYTIYNYSSADAQEGVYIRLIKII